MVKLKNPYIPGFLAYREVPAYISLLDDVKRDYPHLIPQVIMIDGNGILHYRGLGSASHLGYECKIPTIGVAKKLLTFDGLNEDYIRNYLDRNDCCLYLDGRSGNTYGTALRLYDDSETIYVSPGNDIDIYTSTELVKECSAHGHSLPEPIYQADRLSREFLKREYPHLY